MNALVTIEAALTDGPHGEGHTVFSPRRRYLFTPSSAGCDASASLGFRPNRPARGCACLACGSAPFARERRRSNSRWMGISVLHVPRCISSPVP